ncbi:MAG: hypothetical protein HC782_01880 [Gammaproteobacteria bacterium]|nr:hypothetical protein [Gammaproteobacteria bacterium]
MLKTIRREWRVAFSKNAQSMPVRLAKWTLFLAIAMALHESSYFWVWTAGLPLLGVAVHFFYRWKTRTWTRAWGSWDDLDFDEEGQ